MAKSELRIAVVGCGLIGRKHIDVVRQNAKLDALVDPNPAAGELAASLGVPWFAELEAYFAKHRPDGAIIATPNQLHLPHGLACIEAGIPVLIEKPLASTAQESGTLADQAKAHSVPMLVGHHRRHSPLVKAAKAAIEAGQLGRILSVNAQFWLYKPDDYFEMDWRRNKGGGPTFINLIHDIDLLQHFCGPVRRVMAIESSAERGFEVEDTSALLLEFASGALGTVSISDTVVAPWSWELTAGENPAYPKTQESCYTLGGTKASLSIPDLRLWTHTDKRSWWEPIAAENLGFTAADPVVEQFLHFQEVIRGKAEPLVPGHDGARNLDVLEAIKTAAESGKAELV